MTATPNSTMIGRADGEMGAVKLNIAQHNVQSLRCNKNQVMNYLEERNVHVYMVSETWLTPDEDFL